MLTRGQKRKYAEVLLWALDTARRGTLVADDVVLIRFGLKAVPLAETLQSLLLQRGVHPVMRLGLTPTMERNFYQTASERQLEYVGPWEKEMVRRLNGNIYLHAPDSLTHLKDIDPKRIGRTLLARKFLKDMLRKREEQGTYSWTLCVWPTEELAERAGLTPRHYANQIVRACYLDRPEPVAEWHSVYAEAQEIKQWLNGMKAVKYHVESEHTDLTITPGDERRWIGISGHNIPSFEIFLSPDWRGTEGVYHADQPSYRSGNLVEGVTLHFSKGSVVRARARKGRQFLVKQIEMDQGASRIGEFSLTDKRFSRINRFMANTLYDENYGGRNGNCHLALGSSYTDAFQGDSARLTGSMKRRLGFNDSALHWDLVNTEPKTVTAHLKGGSRVVVYENGKFTN